MSNAPKIERRVDLKGRIAFVVAGMVTTYSEQEARELIDDNVGALHCPLTRSIIDAPQPVFNDLKPPTPTCVGFSSRLTWGA